MTIEHKIARTMARKLAATHMPKITLHDCGYFWGKFFHEQVGFRTESQREQEGTV